MSVLSGRWSSSSTWTASIRSANGRPYRVDCSGISRKIPLWAPRNVTSSVSCTCRLPSRSTSRVTEKRSIANEREAAGAAGAERSNTVRTTTPGHARRRVGRRPPGNTASAGEAHTRNLALLRTLELEILTRPETQEAGDQRRREGLDRGVEVAHDCVVVTTRVLDGVLDAPEHRLQLLEILVGLELRIRFGEREELPECL